MLLCWIITLLAAPLLAREPLAERITHTDPSAYRRIEAVHQGAGELHYQGLLERYDLNTNFIFLHRGVLPPKGGIGHHFHHKMEEMYVIFNNEAEFTINGRTSRLKGPAAAPCKMGQSHAIYNHTDQPTEWMNIAVGTVKGKYDAFNLNDDRVGAQLDDPPVFVNFRFDRKLLKPMKSFHGGTGTVHYRRAQQPEVFSTAWAYIDHLVIPPGASTGKRRHVNVEEVYYVMEGTGSVQVNNEQAALRAGDAVPILLNDEQSFVNNTSEDLELLVIGVARVKGVLDPAGF